MFKLKSYISNKARPEGVRAEGYIVEEYMIIVSKYLNDVETSPNQPRRNHEVDDIEVDTISDIFKYWQCIGRWTNSCI